jgi:hypothetical protein
LSPLLSSMFVGHHHCYHHCCWSSQLLSSLLLVITTVIIMFHFKIFSTFTKTVKTKVYKTIIGTTL